MNEQRKLISAGPLRVSDANPRYFTAGADRAGAVYLTGSHIWNMQSEPGPMPSQLSYDAYLRFLTGHGHNFIRLWRWEHLTHGEKAPQPWPRTGPGTAADGHPRFDLSVFDQSWFGQLRDRVIAAGDLGIYVAVMLFEGFGLHLLPPPGNITGHPFHAANNINGIAISSLRDYQVLPLDGRVWAIQEAYIRKAVETVGDLPNVLYEVVNESSGGGTIPQAAVDALGLDPAEPDTGDSTAWQQQVITLIRRHEQLLGYDRHPVGMTSQFPVPDQRKTNEPLLRGPAEWISPGFDDHEFTLGENLAPGRWFTDPPAGDGTKVVISDTDHYAAGMGDALWAWKSFLRGHHPILMDFGLSGGVNPGTPSYESFEPARHAMGDTLRYAQRVDLIDMQPRGDLTSTGFALASPGHEYLILQPAPAESFTVGLQAGTYTAEWHSLASRQTRTTGTVTAPHDGSAAFTAPFTQPGPAVLYLKRTSG